MRQARSHFSKSELLRRAQIALPACACSITDSTVTLLGQPEVYWTNTALAHEGNPMFAWLLRAGPGWFLVGEFVWCAIIVAVVALLPGLFGLMTATAVSVGHTYGALTWLIIVIPIIGLYPVFLLYSIAPVYQTYLYLRPRLRSITADGATVSRARTSVA
ncbi:hypothetical protein [Microbacterium galbinum]|uniref:DUF5658 domain-containing protein n=1 Tax=Microbacterium galbinum TaxID=2851646 RepID=A0ABY4IS58_9MICO|nr:hypothetical protein [Microbacterium galbinum]UPL15474.1 hypothetical protein KV396_13740 [Microbacterium galbinum]